MSNLFKPPLYVQGSLDGIDGNAFAILGYFSKQAKDQGISETDIKIVTDKAMSGNYQDLIAVIDDHMIDE